MKNNIIFIVALVIVSGIILTSLFYYQETQFEETEFYEISIHDLKESYSVQETVEFTVIVNGFGQSCGEYYILVKQNSNIIETWNSISSCVADAPSRNFELNLIEMFEDPFSIILDEPGTYAVEARFTPMERESISTEEIFSVI